MKDMYLEEHTCAFSNENEIEEAYQYYMEKNFGKEDTIVPKCTNPFSEKCLSLDYREEKSDLGNPDWFKELDKSVLPEKVTSCHLINEYCRLPVLMAHDDSIKSNQPYYYGETIIKPATKEMTLEEIEKELGYSIRLKEEKSYQ